MSDQIIVARRFCGPPDVGNGGYVCGLIAGFVEGSAEVTLWRPPPLDWPLDIARTNDGKVIVRHGDDIVAEAQSCSLDLYVPDPPAYREAVEASRLSRAIHNPMFSNCFVCGCDRAEGDGLRVFAGPIRGNRIVAAPWVPDASLADDKGKVKTEFLWAALDCPGAYAVGDEDLPTMLLGRFAANISNHIVTHERCIVIGWQISREGRKLFSGSALFSESGELCGTARATFIEVKSPESSLPG